MDSNHEVTETITPEYTEDTSSHSRQCQTLNSPASTPATKSRHSSALKTSTVSGSLLLRTSTVGFTFPTVAT